MLLLLPTMTGWEEVALQPEAEDVFLMPGGPLRGERLRFVIDAEGRVERVWVGPHPYTPAPARG
jgi:peroxiredoxin